ncbi:hypothetical protein SAMN05660297_03013 [Natronincola peptidivorans]|uniref:Uncharacterized protein n=1 Tax=Natronincola peptidivorans TaxID=426128 RepID=A0A1I0G091_9FIRM|nr:hypothetical protein [Natronincola peptidivorans]SET64120.1 hypothetical protein SAMN05660297_03013 [Natronincola peptidivorans]
MSAFNIVNLFILPVFLAIPAFILYFIIKLAVKNAIKELKEDKTL